MRLSQLIQELMKAERKFSQTSEDPVVIFIAGQPGEYGSLHVNDELDSKYRILGIFLKNKFE